MFLRCDVSIVIGQAEEPIVVHQVVVDISEFFRVLRAEEASVELIDDLRKSYAFQQDLQRTNSERNLFQFRVGVVIVEGVVAAPLQVFNFIFLHTEDEDVVQAHFLGHFDVGSV